MYSQLHHLEQVLADWVRPVPKTLRKSFLIDFNQELLRSLRQASTITLDSTKAQVYDALPVLIEAHPEQAFYAYRAVWEAYFPDKPMRLRLLTSSERR